MTNNPLNGPGSGGQSGKMKPGDTKTITARDRETGEVVKTMTLHRTTRRYVDDLCDAYNADRFSEDLEWYVDGAETLRLGTPHSTVMKRLGYSAANAENSRERWLRDQ